MKVTIELVKGNVPYKVDLVKSYMDDNIEAIERVIDGKLRVKDMVLLMDTKSILEKIKDQLPKGGN